MWDTARTAPGVSATARAGEAADEMAEADIGMRELVEDKLTASAAVGSLAAEEEVEIAVLAGPAGLPSRRRASSCRLDLGLAVVGGRMVGRSGEEACPSRVTSRTL